MSDHLERLEAFLDAWTGAGLRDAIRWFEPDPCAIPAHMEKLAATDLRAAVDELKQLRAQDGHLAGELLRTMGERDAHRRRQIEAERTLIVLLAREGGSTEFTPAELTAVDYCGSFVSSRDVATGNERLGFVTAKQAAAPQQPERGGSEP